MASIKGSRTEKNLLAAFAGESQATMRYGFFAKKAKKEGFEQISAIFAGTAAEERSHASIFYKLLEGGPVEIQATYAAGGNGSTAENLRAAAAGEHEEWTALYPKFAEVAREEGFTAVGKVFDAIVTIEKGHEARYRSFLDTLEAGEVFKRPATVRWRCRECGYVHEGPEAPAYCPACAHPQAYFEISAEG